MGKSYKSKSIQVFAGALIFIAMPLYAAVVLKGGAVFIEKIFEIDYHIALFIFTLIIAAYVIAGGLRGVMYTDALQGTIMFVSMFFLLFWTYKTIGMSFAEANRNLTEMAQLVPEKLQSLGHQGWTSMPSFGSAWWYTLVTSLIMGVGIGVLAQPQLVVRFMTVRSNKELNRAVLIGTVFIAVTTGIIYTVGTVSNIFFMQTEGKIAIAAVKDLDKIIPEYIKASMPAWFAAVFMLTILSASMVSGFGMSLLMLLFTHQKESAALGISEAIFGKPVLFEKMPWPVLDPIVISLPVSIIVIVAVTMLTPKQKAVTVAA